MSTLSLRASTAITSTVSDVLAIEACPLCGDARSALVHRVASADATNAEPIHLRRCRTCEVVFVNPRLDEAELAKLYDDSFYFPTHGSYGALASWVIERIQSARRRRVERLARPGRVLDIGCGDGSFVHHMASHGWDATGIDFSAPAQERAESNGGRGRFLQGTLADHSFRSGSLDLITMWQVLEHISEPCPLLASCHEVLKRDGVLVISVPNLDGWSARLTGSRWWGLDVPRHRVHYTPATLSRTLEAAGFDVVRIRHRSFQYDPYALLHSALDWVFTRRHFLSDLAKRQVSADVAIHEFLYNVGVLLTLGPLLAPLSVATTTVGAWLGRGGFIEVHARRRDRAPAAVRNIRGRA